MILKQHFLHHLKKYLLRFGPLRDLWCFPWESFLRVRPRLSHTSPREHAHRTRIYAHEPHELLCECVLSC